MNESKILEIKEKAKKILGDCRVDILKEEKEITNILERIINTEDVNEATDKKLINYIDEYLKTKEKINKVKENYKFMKELAENLREQKVRRNDETLLRNPLFKVITKDKEYYFLTRKNAHKFIEANKTSVINSEIIEINENENLELEKLIDIIKGNF